MLIDHGLADEIDHHPHRGAGRALAGPGLQEVERALLDRELDVLHVLVMTLEPLGDGEELVVDPRHPLAERLDAVRRPDSGDDVLPLCVGEELRVEVALARARIAREANPGAGRLAEVAEDHGHDRDGGAPVGGDVVDPSVLGRLLREPRVEHGLDREAELLLRFLGEGLARPRAHQLLVGLRQLAQVVGRHVGIGRDAEARLERLQVLVERLAPDAEHDGTEHRDEPSVTVPGEAVVVRAGGEPLDGRIVEPEVQDGLHHAGHRHPGAGANGDEERPPGIAEPQSGIVLELVETGLGLLPEPLREPAPAALVASPGLGRDREPGRDGNAEVGHLGEFTPLAAEQIAHEGRALRLARPERVDVFRHGARTLPRTIKKAF